MSPNSGILSPSFEQDPEQTLQPSTTVDGLFSIECLRSAIDNKTKPPGSLGRIEELAVRIGSLQQTVTPTMNHCRLIIFAGDHGIAESGVSNFPQEVTQQMLANFLAGGAAANVFAAALDVDVQVVDAGVAHHSISDDRLTMRSLGQGTANFSVEAALSAEQLEQALEHGQELGAAGACDAICFGEMGIANTSSATMLFHKVIGLPLEEITGRGTGLDDAGLAHKLAVLRSAAARTADSLDAREAMTEYGGFEIAMMTGAMLGAASQQRLVLVDGFIATAAATAALHMDPSVADALVFAHQSAEQGHAAVIDALDIEPLLDLDLRLGEGTGALLAWPLVKCAAAMLCDMASFESASISGAV